MRTALLALAIVGACTRESARDVPPPHADVGAQMPTTSGPGAIVATVSWPLLDSIRRHLTDFDEQFTRAQQQLGAHRSTPRGDSLFLTFRSAYIAVAESLTNQLDNDSVGQDLFKVGGHEGSADSLRALLQRHGFDLNSSEGNAFVDEDAGRLLDAFGPLLTPAMREYLSIRNVERQARFSEDAALQISWDSLSDRIAVWDQFLQQYPTFTWQPAAQYWRDMYLETYLTGMDNTRTFTDSGTLDPDVRRSYQRFLRDHAGTPAAQVVRDYVALLGASGAPSDSSMTRFFREHKLRSMLGVQPPVN